jgi:streptomycin 6-kinase
VLDELQDRWSVRIGESHGGGTFGLVASASRVDGNQVVVKVSLPDDGFGERVRILDVAQGRGYVRLLAHDPARQALLLEALGPSMAAVGEPPEKQLVRLSATLAEAWQVPPRAGATVAPEEEKGHTLCVMVEQLWEQLHRPCPSAVVEQAVDYARRRSAEFRLDRCVVVHGDPHPGNALQVRSPRFGAGSGYVFVDPDGFLAHPAYDLGVALRDWCDELLEGDAMRLVQAWCRLLARESGVDETAIWEWGFLERVSTGLYLLSLGIDGAGRRFLAAAERLL